MHGSLPTQADTLRLHQRLVNDDPVAQSEIAALYLDHLMAWLAAKNPDAAPDLRDTAAGDALIALFKNPASYDPSRGDFFPYLCLSAQGDLKNALRSEQRHRRHRIPLKSVEDSSDGGKYLGREDDPSLRLCIAEAQSAPEDPAVAAVRASATPEERAILDLMLAGERRTAPYAAVLGLTDRPAAEQERDVKRVKDRLKARLKRAGSAP